MNLKNKTNKEILNLAQVTVDNKDFKKAEKYYNYLLERGCTDKIIYLKKGFIYLGLKDITKSIKSFEKYIEIGGKEKNRAYYGLGYCYILYNNYDLAKENFQKSIYNKEDYAPGYIGLADCYKELTNYYLAINIYKNAIKYSNKDQQVYIYKKLGYIYYECIYDLELSYKYYKKASDLNTDNLYSYFNLLEISILLIDLEKYKENYSLLHERVSTGFQKSLLLFFDLVKAHILEMNNNIINSLEQDYYRETKLIKNNPEYKLINFIIKLPTTQSIKKKLSKYSEKLFFYKPERLRVQRF